MTTLKVRLILTADLTEFESVRYAGREREEFNLAPQILEHAGGCMVVSSKFGELRKEQALAGRARVLPVI